MNEPSEEISPLNEQAALPKQNWVSLALIMLVTCLNAFNDNILKMMLVGLTPKVAQGDLADNIGAWLGAVILLPFVLFAPISGWLADRYSKRSMLIAMLVAQAVILLMTGACFELALGETSIWLALGTFFLLAVQSTFFSPAKMGILKELAGSRRLGMVAGWLQMVTMIGILAGIGVGGSWFDSIYQSTHNPWEAAAWPIWILFGVALVALFLGFIIQRTPAHPEATYHTALWWEHFHHLRQSLADVRMRRAFFGNSTYWFVASMAAAMFVDIGVHLFPDAVTGGAASASSRMTLYVGLGTVAGSLLVSWINRRGLQLGLIPLGALGFAISLYATGIGDVGVGRYFDASLLAVGLLGGCYMVPIQTYIQDNAAPERRGRVLSSMNLMDSLAGVLAVLILVGLKKLGIGFSGQFWFLAVVMCVAAIYTLRILPHHLLRFMVLTVVRSIYKVRTFHEDRLPEKGGVLVLANHVSYVDALVLGAACPRETRFVMWDALYRVKWMTWFLRLMGTVPISATRAKDAVRSVAAALQEGKVVCLFPEGQITRHGLFNELRKGYELMARQGDAPVLPVYLEGLYGSIFSHEGGKCFFKWPKKLRYPVGVYFGEPIAARAASPSQVLKTWWDLSAEALRLEAKLLEPGATDAPESAVRLSAYALLQIEWLKPGETIWCLGAEGGVVSTILQQVVEERKDLKLTYTRPTTENSWLAVGGAEEIQRVGKDVSAARAVFCWDGHEAEAPPFALRGVLWPEKGSRLVSVSVLNPPVPAEGEEGQPGNRSGSLGRVLPGVLTAAEVDAFCAQQRLRVDEAGFLFAEGADRANHEGATSP